LILEGDALQVVNAVNMGSPDWNKMGHLIDGIKENLGKLSSWRVEHVKRDANYAVHILAREVFLVSSIGFELKKF
jgi:hypothetical protein